MKRMRPPVSVVICVRNGEKCIGNCLESLLKQTFDDFEIVIVDDASIDRTLKIISEFKDQRIRLFRNKEWLGIAKSRNIGLKHATGKYIFFTDADMTVSNDWIEQGLRCFAEGCVGVEGRILYVSENYQPTFSDSVMRNREGGNFMTGSVAYLRDIMETVGGFDERLTYYGDRSLGLKIIEHGRVCFNKKMIAVHPQVIMTPDSLIRLASRAANRVYLFKRFGDKASILGRIVNPFNLTKIFFPELVLTSLFFYRFRRKEDFKLLPYTYVYAVLERLYLWKTCAKERVFLI